MIYNATRDQCWSPDGWKICRYTIKLSTTQCDKPITVYSLIFQRIHQLWPPIQSKTRLQLSITFGRDFELGRAFSTQKCGCSHFYINSNFPNQHCITATFWLLCLSAVILIVCNKHIHVVKLMLKWFIDDTRLNIDLMIFFFCSFSLNCASHSSLVADLGWAHFHLASD